MMEELKDSEQAELLKSDIQNLDGTNEESSEEVFD
jgi:hypothetical protein